MYIVQSLVGFNFTTFLNFIRNQTENDRYWQNNNFLLFAKCLKMYSFFAFAFQSLQKAIMTQKKFSFKISIWVSKNPWFYADFKFFDAGFLKRLLKKFKSKELGKNVNKRNIQNLHSFLAIAFSGAFSVGINEIEISIKFCIFYTHIEIFGKNFWVIIALFAKFICRFEKTVHFQTFCKKSKVIILPISIILLLIPIKFETLKPPNVHCTSIQIALQTYRSSSKASHTFIVWNTKTIYPTTLREREKSNCNHLEREKQSCEK